jgi:hypothetical protein
MRTSVGINKKLPTVSYEESSLVDKRFEISNLDLVKGLKEMVYFIDVTDTQFDLYTPRV